MKTITLNPDKSNKRKALKLFTFAALCLITGILFSSCGSVTKRHYTKGYYVSHRNHPGQPTSHNDEKSISAVTEETALQTKKDTSVTSSPDFDKQNIATPIAGNEIAENTSPVKNQQSAASAKPKKIMGSVIKQVIHRIQHNTTTVAK